MNENDKKDDKEVEVVKTEPSFDEKDRQELEKFRSERESFAREKLELETIKKVSEVSEATGLKREFADFYVKDRVNNLKDLKSQQEIIAYLKRDRENPSSRRFFDTGATNIKGGLDLPPSPQNDDDIYVRGSTVKKVGRY